MRTTLDIEEDVLLAAKEIARQKGMTVGRVLSDLARKSLTRKSSVSKKRRPAAFSGSAGCWNCHPGVGQPTARRSAVTIYLLDINLIFALTDPMHVHHEPAHHWFAEIGQRGWQRVRSPKTALFVLPAIRTTRTVREMLLLLFQSYDSFVKQQATIFGRKILASY